MPLKERITMRLDTFSCAKYYLFSRILTVEMRKTIKEHLSSLRRISSRMILHSRVRPYVDFNGAFTPANGGTGGTINKRSVPFPRVRRARARARMLLTMRNYRNKPR